MIAFFLELVPLRMLLLLLLHRRSAEARSLPYTSSYWTVVNLSCHTSPLFGGFMPNIGLPLNLLISHTFSRKSKPRFLFKLGPNRRRVIKSWHRVSIIISIPLDLGSSVKLQAREWVAMIRTHVPKPRVQTMPWTWKPGIQLGRW